ncbi:protein of unknown function [Candidatus Nitrosocosmicus franklandus]|uniref:Uncharacterized protein n=1 Tax=Candidatus Nitrosocosmicus franklandianus TaxID=1798806 RepID=A0A484IGW8_9ARCH|nr:protein of unknown function [Candidatus Nitrosocosmicus franklandus]
MLKFEIYFKIRINWDFLIKAHAIMIIKTYLKNTDNFNNDP